MIFTIIQVLLAISLIAVILLQMQGSGLASTFGGSGEFYRSKRSVEKFLFGLTIVLVSLFALVSIILLFVGKH